MRKQKGNLYGSVLEKWLKPYDSHNIAAERWHRRSMRLAQLESSI